MKSKDQQLLEEAYSRVLINHSESSLRALIAEDYKLIDRLIEEGFGDYLKKIGGAIKGGAQKAAAKIKETLTSGLASTLVKTIISVVPKEELENMINIIAKGQVPKDKMEQIKGLVVQQQGEEAPIKESYITTEQYLAATLFTEANILKALESTNGLLVEAKSGRELQKFAKDVANKINELYPKNKKAMAAAIPKFTDTVSKYLGLPPQTQASSSAPAAEQSNQPAAAPDKRAEIQPANFRATAPQNSQETQQTANNTSQPQSASASFADKVKGAVSNIENKIPTGKGLVAKVMSFVKAHPKISAAAGAALLGIVVAAFAGSAPVVAPALIAAVKGAGIAGTSSIVKQMISGEKVDLKQAGKAAAVGGALGGVGSVIASGLGSIASAVMGVGGGGSQSAPTEGSNNSNSNTSKSWTSSDAHEYDQGESVPNFTREQGIERAREIAQQMGIDPNKAKITLSGNVPSTINGQSAEKFLTPDEKKVFSMMNNVRKQFGMK